MPSSLPVLGFLGLGLMGQPLSQRLLEAGFQLHVWNRTPSKADRLVNLGAHQATSPAAVARQAEIICLCVTDTQSVESLLHQPEGLLEALKPNQLLVDFSSIAPKATQQFAELVRQRGADWVDAPVSGGVPGAKSGQLAIMCGGHSASLKRLAPVFEPLARQVTHLGEVGSGQVAKIGNQMLVSCNALVIAEMMALAEASGLDTQQITRAFAGGFADSLPLQLIAPRIANKDFANPKWTVKTLLKDLELAADLATEYQQALPLSSLAKQLMRMHITQGRSEEDPASLVELYQQTHNDPNQE